MIQQNNKYQQNHNKIKHKPKSQYNYRHDSQMQLVGFQPLMCFLKSPVLSRFLNLIGTIFHIRLPLKQRPSAYLEVLVSGNLKNCLFRRSYQVFFKLKKSFIIGGLKLFIDLYISFVCFDCMYVIFMNIPRVTF